MSHVVYCGGCSPVSLSIPLPMREWEEKEGASSASSPPSCSGDGFATLGASEEVKSPAAMAQAVKVHQDTSWVMYFA